MKTFKVSFIGRKKGLKENHHHSVQIELNDKPDEITGVLPELNKNWEVWELLEIWERIF